MAIYLNNVSVLGVSKEGTFLGDHHHRYRSVKTISIEGFIDSRHSNPDNKGAAATIASIETIRDNTWGTTSSRIPMDDIYINGSGFGKGQIMKLDFPASQEVLQNQIYYGAYSSDIQFYESGNVGATFENVAIPDMEFLEEFSENFNIQLGEDQTYSLSHDIGVRYLSGTRGDGTIVDPIANAKILAGNFYAATPSQFSTAIGNFYGTISSASKDRNTETYNIINGKADFKRRFSLLAESGATYSTAISNTFTMDANGFATVAEAGTVAARAGTDLAETVKSAIAAELSLAYARCNTIYTNFKNTLSTFANNNGTLSTVQLDTKKTINLNEGVGSYSTTFTDNKNITPTHRVERTITLETPTWDGQIVVTEAGTITQNNPKGTWNPSPWSMIPPRTGAKERCRNVYNQLLGGEASGYFTGFRPMEWPSSYLCGYGTPICIPDVPNCTELTNLWLGCVLDPDGVSGSWAGLKHLKNNFSIPSNGKSLTYSYSFTDNPRIRNYDGGPNHSGVFRSPVFGNLFSQMDFNITDDFGSPAQTSVQIPNIPYTVLQLPGQTRLGKRDVKLTAQLRRYVFNPFGESGNSIIGSGMVYDPKNAVFAALSECKEAGYNVFLDNPFIQSLDAQQLHLTSLSYTYNSAHKFEMSASYTYPLWRPTSTENFIFGAEPPTQAPWALFGGN